MRSTASLIILAVLALLVSDARAQEQSISLNIEGASSPLQRTPALVIHEVVAPTVTVKTAPAAALKTQGAPKKDAASKSSAAGAPSLASAIQPIVFPGLSPSVDGEMVTTGNPKYDELIALSAARNGVDPNLVVAMMRQESGFNPRALSYKGASGLMQLMPATAAPFLVKGDSARSTAERLADARTNIGVGAQLLASLLKRHARIDIALAAWSAGDEAVRRSGGQMPPIDETRAHVHQVLELYWALLQDRQAGQAVEMRVQPGR